MFGPVYKMGGTCLQNTLVWLTLDGKDGSVALNPVHTTASYCHKLKVHWKWLNVSPVLSCPGLRSLLGKTTPSEWTLHILNSLLSCEKNVFKTPSLTAFGSHGLWTSSYHLMECQHFHSVTLFGLLLWSSLHLTPQCLIQVILASSLNQCSKPSQQFIIPTCLGFVSFTLFCKGIVLLF